MENSIIFKFKKLNFTLEGTTNKVEDLEKSPAFDQPSFISPTHIPFNIDNTSAALMLNLKYVSLEPEAACFIMDFRASGNYLYQEILELILNCSNYKFKILNLYYSPTGDTTVLELIVSESKAKCLLENLLEHFGVPPKVSPPTAQTLIDYVVNNPFDKISEGEVSITI